MAAHNLPYFPFYPKDFVSDGAVDAMSTVAAGAYIFLLCKAWFEDPPGTLPKDVATLAKWARVSELEWDRIGREVLAAFKDGGTRWVQKRLSEEWKRAKKKHDSVKKAGQLGGLAKAKRRSSDATASLERCSSSESGSIFGSDSSVSRGKSPEKGGPTIPPELDNLAFAEAWADYKAFKAEKGKKYKPKGEAAALSRLAQWGPERAVAAIRHSMAMDWTGIYEEHENGHNGTSNGRTGQRGGATSAARAAERRAEQRVREFAEPTQPLPILRLGGA